MLLLPIFQDSRNENALFPLPPLPFHWNHLTPPRAPPLTMPHATIRRARVLLAAAIAPSANVLCRVLMVENTDIDSINRLVGTRLVDAIVSKANSYSFV